MLAMLHMANPLSQQLLQHLLQQERSMTAIARPSCC
jgi:hypothetical protein